MKYLYMGTDDKYHGPIDKDELLKNGVTATTLVYCKEVNTWTPAGEVTSLIDLFQQSDEQKEPLESNNPPVSRQTAEIAPDEVVSTKVEPLPENGEDLADADSDTTSSLTYNHSKSEDQITDSLQSAASSAEENPTPIEEQTPAANSGSSSHDIPLQPCSPEIYGMFKAPFLFKGRIRRTEYGLSLVINWLIMTLYYIVAYWTITNMMYDGGYSEETIDFIRLFFCAICFIIWIPLCWFSLAQACKRCHDIGKSGWWQLIPIYNPLFLLFAEDEAYPNQYGT